MNIYKDELLKPYEIKDNINQINYPDINNRLEFDKDINEQHNIYMPENQINDNNLFSLSNNYNNNSKYTSNFHIKELTESDKLLLEKYNNYSIDNKLNSYNDVDEPKKITYNYNTFEIPSTKDNYMPYYNYNYNSYNNYDEIELSNKDYNYNNKFYSNNQNNSLNNNNNNIPYNNFDMNY